jgi:hypothetical protein
MHGVLRCLMGAMATLLLAPAAADGAVVWGGGTSQDNPFGLVASPDGQRLTRLYLYVNGDCSDGEPVVYRGPARFAAVMPPVLDEGDNFLTGRRVRGGRIRASGRAVADYGDDLVGRMSEQLSGRVRRGGIASGTLRVRWELEDRGTGATVATCDSGRLRWVARSAPRRVYAGLTSDQEPVVVELNRRRRSVATFRIGWTVDCRPSGEWFFGDRLIRFPLRGGRFGDRFEQRYDRDGGGENVFGYDVRGRLRGTKASGRFGISVREIDAAGTTVADCGPRTVSWRAASTD